MLTAHQKYMAREAPRRLREIPEHINSLRRMFPPNLRNRPIGVFFETKLAGKGRTETKIFTELTDSYRDFKLSLAHPRIQDDIRRHENRVLAAIDAVYEHEQTEVRRGKFRADYNHAVEIFSKTLEDWVRGPHYDDRAKDVRQDLEHFGLTDGEWFDTYMVAKAAEQRWDALRELSVEATTLAQSDQEGSTGALLSAMAPTASHWTMSYLYGHLCEYLLWAERELREGAARHDADGYRLREMLDKYTESVHRAHEAQEKKARGR